MFFILFMVGGDALLTRLRTTDWDAPLLVAIYPVNGDKSAVADKYIKQLSESDFTDVSTFLEEEAKEYKLELAHPVDITFREQIAERPPMPPVDRNVFGVMWWSLKIRFWAKGIVSEFGPPADIQMFVLFHDPETSPRLAHSLGLQKGLLGVVHAFASQREAGKNNMVIAHELLHTVGATDKYDLKSNQPVYPIGYAEPEKNPLLPQEYAEVMAGRIPISQSDAKQPATLGSVLVGEATAREIRWIE